VSVHVIPRPHRELEQVLEASGLIPGAQQLGGADSKQLPAGSPEDGKRTLQTPNKDRVK
jgi:microcompartment protein CcmL/EutN